MSRFKRTAQSVASNYASLITSGLYSVASVPLALHYLSTDRFGLWALMASIGGYLSLIDLGMSSSTARLLIDYKDDRTSLAYGSLIKTGWLVSAMQGMIVFVTGFFVAPALAGFLHIQPDLRDEFIKLLRWQCVALAFSFATRIYSQLLYAHQRLYVTNFSQVGMTVLSYVLLCFFFHRGDGVFSLVWTGLICSVLSAAVSLSACWKFDLFPAANVRGRISWRYFKETFGYGTDMFLVAVGAQLIMASQTMIITRTLGLNAAGAWNVGTKAYTMLSQIIWSVPRMSNPVFSEMVARREQAKLKERYRSVFIATLSLSGFAAVSLVMCNSLLVLLLSHHKFTWLPLNDILLGILTVVLAVVHCHNTFVLMTKKIGFMSYIYFIEGAVFVVSALLAAHWGGLPGIILASIVCSMLFSGAYGVWRVYNYFGLTVHEIAFRWLIPMIRVVLFFTPLAWILWFVTDGMENNLARLVIHVAFCSVVGGVLFLRFGIPKDFQLELLGRAPRSFSLVMRRIFAVTT